MKKCTGEKQKEKLEYFTKLGKNDLGQRYADNSYCLDMEGLYLAGEPPSFNEASLVIGFEPHPDIIFDAKHPDYDEDKAYYYEYSLPILKVT